MFQLLPVALAYTFLAGCSIAQQYPPPVTYDNTLKSPIDPNITFSYKQPNSDTCTTAFETQKQYMGYINLPIFTLAPYQQNYWFFEAPTSPETVPLAPWLSGSSMVGLFQEVDPCEAIQFSNGSYDTQSRVWGWDRSSSLLFIDQPTQAESCDESINSSVVFREYYPLALESRMEPQTLPVGTPLWRLLNVTFASGRGNNTRGTTAVAARACWPFLQGSMSVLPQHNPGIRFRPEVNVSGAYQEYWNTAHVLRSISTQVNFTDHSATVTSAFFNPGDSAIGTQVNSLAELLVRGVRVALIYGDVDIICNWYGGQDASLELTRLVPNYSKAFSASGYANILVNDSDIGGQVRQYGNVSLSRVYDAGHLAPCHQSETAFTVFTRVINGDNIEWGRNFNLSSFGITSTSQDDPVMVPIKPTTTLSKLFTGVYVATRTPTSSATSGAARRASPHFRLPRQAVAVFIPEQPVKESRKTRNGLIGGLAAAGSLLLTLLGLLCCRCCWRRRNKDRKVFDDTEKSLPAIVTRVREENPVPSRHPTIMQPIPERSMLTQLESPTRAPSIIPAAPPVPSRASTFVPSPELTPPRTPPLLREPPPAQESTIPSPEPGSTPMRRSASIKPGEAQRVPTAFASDPNTEAEPEPASRKPSLKTRIKSIIHPEPVDGKESDKDAVPDRGATPPPRAATQHALSRTPTASVPTQAAAQ